MKTPIEPRSSPSSITDRPPRGLAREIGPVTILLLAFGYAVLWLVAKPSRLAVGSYLGQWFGAESILLLSIALVLISTLPWVEVWFDGIDRAAIWHRRVAMVGLVLLLPHILLSTGNGGSGRLLGLVGVLGLVTLVIWAILPRWQSVVPRPLRGLILTVRDGPGISHFRKIFGGYERWRALHRTTGLFVATGFAHALLDGTPFGAEVLRWSLVAIGGIGLAFYLHRELFARFFLSHHDYQVQTVREVSPGIAEISLRPLGRAMDFVAGQFAMVYLEGKDGWHRHPFTIASAPHENVIRITVKALGDYTSRLTELIEPGMPAVIGEPHGRFFHSRGTDRQIWIAGGVGVAPFLSWLRALDQHATRQVDFFYSADGPAPFTAEITAITAQHKRLRTHLIDTRISGRLTSDQVLQIVGGDPKETSVFMCGPAPMVQSLQTGLRAAGVHSRHIHREYFDWR